jgi:hypothetical protein
MVFDQLASSYGLLEEVGWQGIFSSFYETIRMKIKCRDASKIPKERLSCIDKKLYKIVIIVELPKPNGGSTNGADNDDGDDDETGKKDEENFDEYDGLEDEGS